ncbi:hypothetical protein LTR35_002054 [Friedmanniomyces endolithicus]|nr:hypothetical protein LTR35_002054 [Friedmanniomyces endolithicus]
MSRFIIGLRPRHPQRRPSLPTMLSRPGHSESATPTRDRRLAPVGGAFRDRGELINTTDALGWLDGQPELVAAV